MKISYSLSQYCQQRQKEKPVWVYPVLMAMQAEYYRDLGNDVYWGECDSPDKIITEPENIDFLKLPIPDRVFTKALDTKYQKYGNYKYLPATHMQVADGCWWGKCSFCVENKKEYSVRSVDHVIMELFECDYLGFREVFDDSGTFPTGEWMEDFCKRKKQCFPNMVLGCNMRVCDADFDLMKEANFRMVLFGIESKSQRVLNQINKGVDSERIIPVLKKAVKAGLEPHGAFLFGCPGSSEKEEVETLKFIHFLLRKGYLCTAQASVHEFNGVRGNDRGFVRRIYNAGFQLEFWINKLIRLRNFDDCKYLIKQIRKGIKRD